MSSIETILIAGVLVPLASFAVLALFGSRIGKPHAGWLATAAIATSCVLAAIALVQWNGTPPDQRPQPQSFAWANLGDVPITFGINLDSLTLIMFFMVSLVSSCIFLFSIGYMAGHSDQIDGQSQYHRFFAYLSLFCFSMLGLVVADNLLLLFVFWELVGLCSYLLIGFYFHKRSASNAAIKAFVTNRVGDMGFILGIAMVYAWLGDLSLTGAAQAFKAEHANPHSPLFLETFASLTLATWMGLALFCGAVGKSAQFPLHVWLPDAMEGPAPVSALIHAATMVAAGVYLVARIFVLLTPDAQFIIAFIGCITLALAALIAIVQTDIKRVLAYSTISQLGYMVLGMGVGAWIGALFHLLTHAFFKALMFLGSGQVIEGCHHEQDIRNMGGLRKKMPVTCWTFFVGVLAIAGAGIPLTHLGLGGFFSKDEILAVAYHQVYGVGALHRAFFWVPVVVAYLTPFYMMRCWWLTFMGQPRNQEVYDHAHESKLMYVPLVVLAAGTVAAGYWLFRPMVVQAAESLEPGFLAPTVDGETLHQAHHALAYIVGGAFVAGFLAAWLIYRNGLSVAETIARRFGVIHHLLLRKFYFDDLYGLVFVGGIHLLRGLCNLFDRLFIDQAVDLSARITQRLSRFSGDVLDNRTVDGAVNAIGQGTWRLGDWARAPQVGRIRNYILFAVCGTTVVLILMVIPWK